MKDIGKHRLEYPVVIEFEIAAAPQYEEKNAKKIVRKIKKDTKLLLRTLDKMARHGWAVVEQTDGEEAANNG